jgi:dephospho-CoA kinase
MLIGITGTFGAGKGAVVDYLVSKKGFRHVSARQIWTQELEARSLPVNRDSMTAFANQMRAEHGPAYFMERALATVVGPNENVVIESVRTVSEAELLSSNHGVLLAIDADIQERYRRISGRGSALDNVSYEDFVRQEAAEMENSDPNKQNIAKVKTMANYVIDNNQSIKELRVHIEKFLDTYKND